MNVNIGKVKCGSLIFHPKVRVKRKAVFERFAPPREWKEQPLNKLKLYRIYKVKKAEITPIR